MTIKVHQEKVTGIWRMISDGGFNHVEFVDELSKIKLRSEGRGEINILVDLRNSHFELDIRKYYDDMLDQLLFEDFRDFNMRIAFVLHDETIHVADKYSMILRDEPPALLVSAYFSEIAARGMLKS